MKKDTKVIYIIFLFVLLSVGGYGFIKSSSSKKDMGIFTPRWQRDVESQYGVTLTPPDGMKVSNYQDNHFDNYTHDLSNLTFSPDTGSYFVTADFTRTRELFPDEVDGKVCPDYHQADSYQSHVKETFTLSNGSKVKICEGVYVGKTSKTRYSAFVDLNNTHNMIGVTLVVWGEGDTKDKTIILSKFKEFLSSSKF